MPHYSGEVWLKSKLIFTILLNFGLAMEQRHSSGKIVGYNAQSNSCIQRYTVSQNSETAR
jgi:hypothetical protein